MLTGGVVVGSMVLPLLLKHILKLVFFFFFNYVLAMRIVGKAYVQLIIVSEGYKGYLSKI